MAHSLKLLFAAPDAQFVETGDGLWAFSGERTDDIRRLVAGAHDFSAVRDQLVELTEDAVVVHVSSNRSRGEITAFRSVTATRDLYYLRASDGSTVLTDHFRTALSHLDVAERDVPRTSVVDHLLFRAPIEPRTYVARIHALGQGERVHWSGTRGEWITDVVDTLSPVGSTAPERGGAAVDARLSDVLETWTDEGDGLMFSGGVDSTLLHTYLDDPRPLLMGADSPEFSFETEYAERSLSLLDDTADQRVVVREDDFLDRLEASVDALGFPSHYNQTVVTDAAFRRARPGRYVNGEGADALFGLTGTKGYRVADWADPLLSERVVDALSGTAPDAIADPYATLAALRERIDRPLEHHESFANQLAFFTDADAVADLVDRSLVGERYRRQAEYVRRRTDRTDEGGFAGQAEFGHLLSFFRHNTVNQWRQLGYAHGQTVFAPFKTRSMARCALSIPAERRYVQGPSSIGSLSTKYLLKDLLEERLPGYAVDQPKGSGSLPIERYFDDGALADVFERYAPPAFVPEDAYHRHVDSFGPVTWNLVTYAVWRDRVLRNPDVEPHHDAARRHVRIATEPPAPGRMVRAPR